MVEDILRPAMEFAVRRMYCVLSLNDEEGVWMSMALKEGENMSVVLPFIDCTLRFITWVCTSIMMDESKRAKSFGECLLREGLLENMEESVLVSCIPTDGSSRANWKKEVTRSLSRFSEKMITLGKKCLWTV